MGEFIAREGLDTEYFEAFSGQCIKDHERILRKITESSTNLKEAKITADYWQSRRADSISYCAKHGVSLNAI